MIAPGLGAVDAHVTTPELTPALAVLPKPA
jgi:hypothetical protein